jgi:hypothetical protein
MLIHTTQRYGAQITPLLNHIVCISNGNALYTKSITDMFGFFLIKLVSEFQEKGVNATRALDITYFTELEESKGSAFTNCGFTMLQG